MTALLKRGNVAKLLHLPDTSTIHPCVTPHPASRWAVLNSAAVICAFLLKGVDASPRQPASTRCTFAVGHCAEPAAVGMPRSSRWDERDGLLIGVLRSLRLLLRPPASQRLPRHRPTRLGRSQGFG